mgnify:CR=1 FL=1
MPYNRIHCPLSPATRREQQHPIHQPTLTKALLSDFTPARPLFEGLGRDAGPGLPCGAAARDLMNLDRSTASPS